MTFDMRLDALLGLNFEQFGDQLKHDLSDFLSGEIEVNRSRRLSELAVRVMDILRTASPKKRNI
jgi:hypothetical protein